MNIECTIIINFRTRGSLSQATQSTQSTQFMQSKESPLVSSVISVRVLPPSISTVSSPSLLLCTETASSPLSSYTSCNPRTQIDLKCCSYC